MAQKKKKGPAPNTNEVKRNRLSFGQIIFYFIGLLIVASMVLSMLVR